VPRRLFAAVCALLTALVVAGCGGPGAGPSSPTSTAPPGTIDDVTVSSGATPTLTLTKKPVAAAKTTVKVVKPGTGKTIQAGQDVTVAMLVVDGRSGDQIDSSFGKDALTFVADPHMTMPGLVTALTGQSIGSRILAAIPPADGFGSAGNTQFGVEPTDTLLLLIDIQSARTPLSAPKGTAVPPKAGLPTVTVDSKEHATITIPKTDPPTSLVAQPLIKGDGTATISGQTLSVQYTGVVWRTGKEFDSTLKSNAGHPYQFQLGAGTVITGWEKSLIGQAVGSRLLLVIPPADGYPDGASANGVTIEKTDTLVFVVDLLDAF
jgi:peptidylprolyl isomerase